jgi:acetolactate synthase I/II/III large subunit
MKVSELIIRSLEEYGIKRVYGLIGTSILELIDAAKDSSIRYVSTRHEQVAVSMADADGRVTGRPGVAFVHGGPGFLNSMVSLANAYKDSSPLLLVAGAVKRRMVGLDSWLEVPQSEMARSVVKAAFRVERGQGASKVVSDAYSIAASDPKGPVLLEVPEDLWPQEAGQSVAPLTQEKAPAASPEDVRKVWDAISLARKPLIVAGGGLNNPRGAAALKKLVSKFEVPVVTTGNGRGAISEGDRLSLGRIGFGGGNRVADGALQEADVVVCLGGGLSDVSTYGFNLKPRGTIFVVDLDPIWDRKPVPYAMHVGCDASSFAEGLAMEARERKIDSEWLGAIDKRKEAWRALLREEMSRRKPGFVNTALFLSELDSVLPSDTIITAGQGLHILYAYSYMKVRSPASFLAATNMGSMGFVFPAALGAKLSHPEREVVAVMGDGEFMMTVQDIETAVREKIGAKIVIVNDCSYRVLLMRQKLQKMGRVFGTLHSNPDIVKLADSFGAGAMSVDSEGQVEEAVKFLTAKSEVPMIVELKVDPEDLPPLNLEGSLMF